MVKFISYDGKYPNLCSGTLVIEVNGKTYSLKYALDSGGGCGFDRNGDSWVEYGPWTLRKYELPDELVPYIREIEFVVNENVRQGCCGGCL